MSKRKDDLENHLLTLCEQLTYEEFFDLCSGLPDFSDTLHDQLIVYASERATGNARRPLNQNRMLALRDGLLTNLEQKEMAQEESMSMEMFTEEQKQAAQNIVQTDNIRPRQRLINEVLTMPAPAGVSIKLDEHDRIAKYAGYLPAYAAYALIDHFKEE